MAGFIQVRTMRFLSALPLTLLPLLSCFASAEPVVDSPEPQLKGDQVVQLITDHSLEGWKVPSTRWSIKDGAITGDTMGVKLQTPEWLYTNDSFTDFIFSAEVKLSGGPKANSGIYFRVTPFTFTRGKPGTKYEAPSGYEYDAGLGSRHNGSLGDWYARPKLRIFADQKVMKQIFKAEDWNRMTIRAKGKHIEYWLNGTKIIDYTDNDPKRSKAGPIGIQMHDNLVMKVALRKAVILPLVDDQK
ncbi:Unannotated [Lentimonas sp. CC4]|nr:Unannotated [Lentimonas sp. CC4]CAA6685499.1 Unannotated [Lentimonas sp. CC6]CAA7076947.1 Unannotated [Lentimonas sp. CC4]CAA7170498.1 Unannotated [Lentimonas sp. CC21]CAA7179806.1 Unannotated [Lentimonas sp. CC8]